MTTQTQLPLPKFFDPARVGDVWRVPYQQRAEEAKAWANKFGIPPAEQDPTRVCLLLVDVQNTFCIPEFELFVGGRSGMGAVERQRPVSANSSTATWARNYHHCRHHGYPHRYAGVPCRILGGCRMATTPPP